MIWLKNEEELIKMREAGRIVAEALAIVRENVRPDVSTQSLDTVIRDYVISKGGTLLFYKYKGFPAHSCISINEEVVHGIPRERRKLKEGDIVSIDIGVRYKGYCGDSAWTFPVGAVSDEARRLLDVGETALAKGIEACRVNQRVSNIGRAIQEFVESHGYHVVKQYVGHGIGQKLHEDPQVPNYVDRAVLKNDPVLKAGVVLAVEPMVNAGTENVKKLDDGWTVITADRSLSVHFEHTVAVTEDGPWVLTTTENGR